MKESVTIKIDLLPDGAKQEVIDFYEYLLHKHSRNIDMSTSSDLVKIKKKPLLRSAKSFFKKIDEFSFELPKDYQFNRDSLYDR